MKRATFLLGLASSAVAVTFVTLVYGIGSHQSSSTVEPRRGEAAEAPQASSQETEGKESTVVVVSERSSGDHQNPTATEAHSNSGRVAATGLINEDTARRLLKQDATRDVQELYSLLFKDLSLTPSEEDALLSLLIELRIASTSIRDSRGKTIIEAKEINEHERSNRIAAIIGHPKLQQFLALERNIDAYGEVLHIGSMLQQNGVPLADTQRDELLNILVEVREQYQTPPPSDVQPSPIEWLEYRLAQMDEVDRHVMELAPSVLSPEQVQYLFEQYQYLSYRRAYSLEAQKEARADPMIEDLPPGYPAWSN